MKEWWGISRTRSELWGVSTCFLLSSCNDADSAIAISCLVDPILPVMLYGRRRGDEEKLSLEYWRILCLEFLFAAFRFNFPLWALCPLWHEISMSQGPDRLWLSDLIWASVKQMKCFYLCVWVWVWLCMRVLILVYKDTKGDGCNRHQF